ncbi:telomere-protecting terminal protein Tpg [Streptomyces sp. NPDC101149]|uniref:telomere-protecting terminal protein Tpg n=1 Tax=Streptomyces sp. NPDC101149 TaxID=3366113 RepID=UPI0038178A03
MGLLTDSLDKADTAHFTRPLPKSAKSQMQYLVKQIKGTKAAADMLGITQRTVERYLKGQIKHPRRDLAEWLAAEVTKRWQPRVRDRAKKQAATTGGIYIDTRARFGFTAAPGTTDDPRLRPITQGLPPAYAQRLFDAHAAEQQLQDILAEGLQEICFKDRGRRADGLTVEFTDIDYIDVDY